MILRRISALILSAGNPVRSFSTKPEPLKFCIVGAGPAGFYSANLLLKKFDEHVNIDLLDRLPSPYGLVRSGVAPDHQDTKNVINQFSAIAKDQRVKFWGGVTLGRDVTLSELRKLYHGVIISTGAEGDRQLGIPGEAGPGVFSAREFVWWYNGHPDARDLPVDLSRVTSVAICGIGNVALDCARVLLRNPHTAPLATSDIAAHALHHLKQAAPQLKDIHLVARRGPVQAACTPKELKELVSEPGLGVMAGADQLAVSEADKAAMKAVRMKRRVYDLMSQATSQAAAPNASRHLHFQFYRQPREVVRDAATGLVTGLQVEKTRLQEPADGTGAAVAVGTGELQVIPAQLILVSIGYKSRPVQDLPFNSAKGIIPNTAGRVHETAHDAQGPVTQPGVYVCGWCKRGPTGIIGTNLVDADDTVRSIEEDVKSGLLRSSNGSKAGGAGLATLLTSKRVEAVGWEGWERIDAHELAAGKQAGKVREKVVHLQDMLHVARGSAV